MIKKKQLHWLIVGGGSQADRLAKAISEARCGILYSVYDKDIKRAKSFAKNHSIKYTPNSFQGAINDPVVDIVVILTPNYLHAKQAIDSIRAGKHVFCEKPMTLTINEGRRLSKELKHSTKKTLGVGFHLRFHPLIAQARKIISSGKIGKCIFVRANWAIGEAGTTALSPLPFYMRWREKPTQSGGGALMARGVHLLDVLPFLIGQDITEVHAYVDLKTRSVDRTAVAILLLNEIPATISTSKILPYSINEIIIYGSNGRIILRDIFNADGSGEFEFLTQQGKKSIKGTKKNLYVLEIKHFANNLGNNIFPVANIADGFKCVATTEAFIKSAKTGRSVKVSNFI